LCAENLLSFSRASADVEAALGGSFLTVFEPESPDSQKNQRKNQPTPRGKQAEWLVGVAIAFLLAVVAVPGIKSTPQREFANVTVRGLEDLLRLARDEAIQTGDDHILFFEIETIGTITNDRGAPVMALLIRDRDGDGRRADAEYVASVPIGADGSAAWGSESATVPADGDTAGQLSGPWSFGQAMGYPGRLRRLVFRSDGAPHSFTADSETGDTAGSGAGTVYLHSSTADYAVVLSPWGDVNVQVWDPSATTWRPASIR
jgi:hypothetical protein